MSHRYLTPTSVSKIHHSDKNDLQFLSHKWKYTLLLIATLCFFAKTSSGNTCREEVASCEGLTIGILALNDLSAAAGVPQCTLNDVHVSRRNGIVYTLDETLENPAPHQFGTHAAPWFLQRAIQSSKYYTADLDKADIIYVYDYCYYIVWLGHCHAMGYHSDMGPGDHLLKLYSEMMKLPVWQKSKGAHFVFYEPHPGFSQGLASGKVRDMRCNEFTNATHMIVDTPMRNVCETFWQLKNKLLVTPYNPSPLDVQNPQAYLHQPLKPLAERKILGYCRSTCDPWTPDELNTGKMMRYWFSYIEWGNSTEMDVRCTDQALSAEGHLSFSVMYESMRNSIFCPVFPGDAASTRRLSEIFLAGCIPVFIGPPYHSMPFSETVPYKEVGIFVSVANTQHWLIGGKAEWQFDPVVRAIHETEARWWIPDVDISDSLLHVKEPSDVLSMLKSIPPEKLEQKLALMHEYGTRFSFLQRLTSPPNAINSLLDGMCLKQRQYPATFT